MLGLFVAAGVLMSGPIAPLDWWLVGACTLASWIGLHAAYRRNVAADAGGRPEIGFLMTIPYGRLLPLFFCLGIAMAGARDPELNRVGLVLFGTLATIIDAAIHIGERWVHADA